MPKEQNYGQTISPVDIDILDSITLSDNQKEEIEHFYEESIKQFKAGNIVQGTVLDKTSQGVLVDIDYKSNGLIPNYEFSSFELKKIHPQQTLEVLINRLEDETGSVELSYQKAKSIKAWNKIMDLAQNDEPVVGTVTHRVKGGLNVDIGIPAFLPGSQVDIQRVTDFDQFVGTEITAKIIKVNKKRGNIILSRRKYLDEQRDVDKQKALEVLHEGAVVQGIVKNITSYGAFVDLGGIDGLLHITDMSWGRISHPSEVLKIGDTITVKVLSFDKKHEKISLGMKQLTENPWDTIEQRYPLGSHVKGTISSITDYGLFVEIENGIEGLVHISEISWTERMKNLANHFKVGQEIEVCIVAISKENKRMSLSIKQLGTDPWKVVAERYNVGDKVKGKITNITDFGIFVQIYDGVDGLIHVSDISWTEHITHPADKYNKGDEVEAVILTMDTEGKKISLGIKQLEADPWDTINEDYPVGTLVEGTISKVTNFGAFVKLPNGIEALVHISELSPKEHESPEDIVLVGQTKTFRVIKVNKEERKLGLSLRGLGQPSETGDDDSAHERPDRSQPTQKKPVRKNMMAAPEPTAKNQLQKALQDFQDQQKQKNDAPKD